MTTAATASALNLFIPITKVDVAQRLVYGLATAEKVDRSGEVCDYATTKPFYEKWSGDIHKTTGGKSLGNLRAMHGKVAAGKLTSINFNDAEKQIEICSKVVDDNEWNKVLEGVYTGFSQGGAYVKRWKDGDVQKYTADPGEVSLVDLPCLDIATFSVIKADGSTELRKFVTVPPAPAEPTNDEVVQKATELAKAAGAAGFADFIVAAREELTKALNAPEKPAEVLAAGAVVVPPVVEKTAQAGAAAVTDDIEQVWLSKRDGKTFKTKAELRKHHDDLDAAAALAPAVTPIQTALDEISTALGIDKAAAAKPGKTDVKADAAASGKDQDGNAVDVVTGKRKKKAKKDYTAEDLKKGLYDVGRLCNLIAELNWFAKDSAWEREMEGDASVLPEQLKSAVASLCQALRDMVVEETSELFDPENENDALLITVMEMAAGVPVDAMNALVKLATADAGFEKCRDAVIKAGARHSKADQTRIQDAHDNMVAAGADCGIEKSASATDLTKHADELSKAIARGDALQKTVDGILPQIADIQKAVKHLLDQPVAHPLTRVIGKGQDNGGDAVETPEAILAKMTPDEVATMMIKIAQQNPQPLLSRGK